MGTTDIDGELLVDIETAAELIGKSTSTVYRIIRKMELDYRKKPGDGKGKVTLSSIERWKSANGMSVRDLSMEVLGLKATVRKLQEQVAELKGQKPTSPTGTRAEHDPDAIRQLFASKHKNLSR